MKSQYKSSKSVAKNPTISITVDDPRLRWDKISTTKSRIGAEIDIIGLDGKSLINGGKSLTSASGLSSTIATDKSSAPGDTVTPAMNGYPSVVYPGQGPVVISPTDPTNVTASWSGEDLVVQFDWDYSNELNVTVSQFILELVADGVTKRTPLNAFPANKTQTAQTITLTKALNSQTFGIFRTQITSICVLIADPLSNISNTICAAIVPTYVLDLPTPTITVASIIGGYSVAYTTPTQSSFNAIEIVEYESDATTEPTGVQYSRTYLGTINPSNVIVHNLNPRWVKARFTSDSGLTTSFSSAVKVTPTTPINVDNTPPNEVTQVSAAWSGDNIIVDYTLPSQDPATRIQIQLTAPNNYIGQFYRFPDGTGNNQTAIITKRDLFDQFGEHFSSFSGVLRSVDSLDNKSSGISFLVPTRTNPLSGVTPTFTVIALSNAYSVNFTMPNGAVYAEVYAKHTAWSGNPTNDDYVVYRGVSPAVVVDTDYTTVYIKIRYYDDFNNTSNYSAEGTITPLNPGEITSFENPISFGENAVIFAGNSPTSGTRTLFKPGGIFAYDSTNTSPSTQIVSNASAGTPTFITTQAQIADWNITETKIENTLSGTPTKYTGLSATGTYSFWAGSDVSGGNSSADFTVTPTGVVTARNITIIGNGNSSSNLISAGGLFTVKNDGTFTATGATINGSITATGGEFTGNVKLNGGSLYALGTGGTISSGIRTIFNSSGIAAYNASGGYTAILTTPLANGAIFTTNAADIGGWTVDSNRIYKTSISGKGNIEIDSTNGYISVSNPLIPNSKAGINSPGNDIDDYVFWAGENGPTSSLNPFRVTLGGKLFATGAQITGGSITSSGALGSITIDGVNDLISMKPADQSATSYLFPRNGNVFLTSGNPFIGGNYNNLGTPSTGTTGLASSPYLAAGKEFIDRYGATVSGIGIYTGAYTGSGTKPFLSATTTGIQIKASDTVSFNAEQSLGIRINAGNDADHSYIDIKDDGIILYSSAEYDPEDSPYTGPAAISLMDKRISIYGLRSQGHADIERRIQYVGPHVGYRLGKSGEDLYPMGQWGRQRTVVQNEYTGALARGFGVYYGNSATDDPIDANFVPNNSAGLIGDIFIVYNQAG